MTDIVELIKKQNQEAEDQAGSKFYVPFDNRTILMEHALTAVEEIEKLRLAIAKLAIIML
jgi:hypothetical protein